MNLAFLCVKCRFVHCTSYTGHGALKYILKNITCSFCQQTPSQMQPA